MRILIKNLKGEQFELEVDPSSTVYSLKEQIQSMQGHETSLQKLIHAGQVLKDDSSLSSLGVSENSVIVLMVNKPKPVPRVEKVEERVAEVPVMVERGEEGPVSNLMAMGFPRDQAMAALQAASNDSDLAVEYLMSGIPEAPPDLSQNPLAFLADNPSFQQIKDLIQQNPTMISSLLQQLSESNPELADMIVNNQDAFMQLIGDIPAEEDDDAQIDMSEADRNAIDRLVQLGFQEEEALQAYLSCDRNEEMAANLLFDNFS